MKRFYLIIGLIFSCSFLSQGQQIFYTDSTGTGKWDSEMYSISLIPVNIYRNGEENIVLFYNAPRQATITIRDAYDMILTQETFIAPETVSLFVIDPQQCRKIEIEYDNVYLVGYF